MFFKATIQIIIRRNPFKTFDIVAMFKISMTIVYFLLCLFTSSGMLVRSPDSLFFSQAGSQSCLTLNPVLTMKTKRQQQS